MLGYLSVPIVPTIFNSKQPRIQQGKWENIGRGARGRWIMKEPWANMKSLDIFTSVRHGFIFGDGEKEQQHPFLLYRCLGDAMVDFYTLFYSVKWILLTKGHTVDQDDMMWDNMLEQESTAYWLS